jgi:type II restriction/modification system DNA methylase subunit YeeA
MASNRNVLKKYAPLARLNFIQVITNRAAQFGITKDGSAAGELLGDLFILDGKSFPRSLANQRGRLVSRIARDGFAQVMEAVAYTWFNRFLAIRYMELHDYFDHGCRVLSNPNGHAEPELLERATSIDLPGLNRDEIVNLKLDGTKDEQIYRKLLIAQCNDLHRSMPFLFEKIDDETELLLPENLLQSDSVVRKLVNDIAEGEWREIEIIGWLYQFYISDKKDQVIGKVVKSEDIPAATQLFTPNWIVKYMVQNSLGAQWLATYPDSGIRSIMDYYIAPAEQVPKVQVEIDAITPKHLDPEGITLIDPAVGSGHILVEAYDLFRAIYLERGYTKREAARAILTKNLFGLDIDDRAAQMAGFALLMKACADDRTVLRNPPKLNVLALTDSNGLDAEALAKALLPQEPFEMVPSGDLLPETLSQPSLSAQQPTSAKAKAIKELVVLFEGAKTFGSLITVPETVTKSLPLLDALLAKPLTGDLLFRQAQEDAQEALKPLVEQARLLGDQYDCVVANPPYIGGNGMNARLKNYLQRYYTDVKSDVFSAFIVRDTLFAKINGRLGFMSPFVWMFIASYEKLRGLLLNEKTITSLVQLEYSGFDGATVPICTFTISNGHIPDFKGGYVRLSDFRGSENQAPKTREAIAKPDCGWFFRASASDLAKIPGSPIAYWLKDKVRLPFQNETHLVGNLAKIREGINTGDNNRFLRLWFEVSDQRIARLSDSKTSRLGAKWFFHRKGGEFRRWYGHNLYVLNWEDNGKEIHEFHNIPLSFNGAPMRGKSHFFEKALSWTRVSSGKFAIRTYPENQTYDSTSPSIFYAGNSHLLILSFLNSKVSSAFLEALSPTLDFRLTNVGKLPITVDTNSPSFAQIDNNSALLVGISELDWSSHETSPEFAISSLLLPHLHRCSLSETCLALSEEGGKLTDEMQRLEEENNRLFIEAYGLEGELTSNVPLSEITLICNSHYRYGSELTNEEREVRLKSDAVRELVSYAIGCIMGRYSLAEPGLIYANSGGVGFDPSRYGTFPADDDGIIPMTEERWFSDDAAARIEEFLSVAWPEAPIMETMVTLIDGLDMGKAGEPRAALRTYLSKQFFKDHLQTYKNRPIYWLFSSGKQKAFEALVYLHRYNEGTLARMRTVYVTPLMGKLQQRISDLDSELVASSSSAEKTRKGREKDKLAKQVIELRQFDEELRHLADQRIPLDLDDGVKANYARFGKLLAAKDKVCPKKKGEDE